MIKIPLLLPVCGLLLVLFGHSCQYPINNYELPNAEKFLVIDAQITPVYAKLTVNYTVTGITSTGGYTLQSPDFAQAYIQDSHGQRWNLGTKGEIDSSFNGLVGETYQLFVKVDGQNYESDPEIMRPCPPLDSVSVLYSQLTYLDPTDLNYDGFDIYAQFTDFPGRKDFYQWDWVHYYHQSSCGIKEEYGGFYRLPCVPSDCWGINYNTRVITANDELKDGKPIAQSITRVPMVIPPNKYYLRVEQRAITPKVFEYLKSLETQTQNVGTPFDVPAQTKFNPNVHNSGNPSEKILGVFNVFSYQRKVIYIDMLQPIPGAKVRVYDDTRPFSPDLNAMAPCTEGLYQTQKRPEGWKE